MRGRARSKHSDAQPQISEFFAHSKPQEDGISPQSSSIKKISSLPKSPPPPSPAPNSVSRKRKQTHITVSDIVVPSPDPHSLFLDEISQSSNSSDSSIFFNSVSSQSSVSSSASSVDIIPDVDEIVEKKPKHDQLSQLGDSEDTPLAWPAIARINTKINYQSTQPNSVPLFSTPAPIEEEKGAEEAEEEAEQEAEQDLQVIPSLPSRQQQPIASLFPIQSSLSSSYNSQASNNSNGSSESSVFGLDLSQASPSAHTSHPLDLSQSSSSSASSAPSTRPKTRSQATQPNIAPPEPIPTAEAAPPSRAAPPPKLPLKDRRRSHRAFDLVQEAANSDIIPQEDDALRRVQIARAESMMKTRIHQVVITRKNSSQEQQKSGSIASLSSLAKPILPATAAAAVPAAAKQSPISTPSFMPSSLSSSQSSVFSSSSFSSSLPPGSQPVVPLVHLDPSSSPGRSLPLVSSSATPSSSSASSSSINTTPSLTDPELPLPKHYQVLLANFTALKTVCQFMHSKIKVPAVEDLVQAIENTSGQRFEPNQALQMMYLYPESVSVSWHQCFEYESDTSTRITSSYKMVVSAVSDDYIKHHSKKGSSDAASSIYLGPDATATVLASAAAPVSAPVASKSIDEETKIFRRKLQHRLERLQGKVLDRYAQEDKSWYSIFVTRDWHPLFKRALEDAPAIPEAKIGPKPEVHNGLHAAGAMATRSYKGAHDEYLRSKSAASSFCSDLSASNAATAASDSSQSSMASSSSSSSSSSLDSSQASASSSSSSSPDSEFLPLRLVDAAQLTAEERKELDVFLRSPVHKDLSSLRKEKLQETRELQFVDKLKIRHNVSEQKAYVHLVQQLPQFADQLYYYFDSQNLKKDLIIDIITGLSHQNRPAEETKKLLLLLIEKAPEWLTRSEIQKGSLLQIKKEIVWNGSKGANEDRIYLSVCDKLKQLAKTSLKDIPTFLLPNVRR